MKKAKKYYNKRVFRKTVISKEEYDQVTTQASAASSLLKSDRFEFFRELLLAAKNYASESIIENTVKDVTEEIGVSERLKKTFFTPRKVQIDELSGQYKLVKKIFEDLQYFVDLKKNVDEQIADKKVSVE